LRSLGEIGFDDPLAAQQQEQFAPPFAVVDPGAGADRGLGGVGSRLAAIGVEVPYAALLGLGVGPRLADDVSSGHPEKHRLPRREHFAESGHLMQLLEPERVDLEPEAAVGGAAVDDGGEIIGKIENLPRLAQRQEAFFVEVFVRPSTQAGIAEQVGQEGAAAASGGEDHIGNGDAVPGPIEAPQPGVGGGRRTVRKAIGEAHHPAGA